MVIFEVCFFCDDNGFDNRLSNLEVITHAEHSKLSNTNRQIEYNRDSDTGRFLPKEILERAASKGTELHKAIEDFEKEGKPCDLKEFKNYLFLKKQYQFEKF